MLARSMVVTSLPRIHPEAFSFHSGTPDEEPGDGLYAYTINRTLNIRKSRSSLSNSRKNETIIADFSFYCSNKRSEIVRLTAWLDPSSLNSWSDRSSGWMGDGCWSYKLRRWRWCALISILILNDSNPYYNKQSSFVRCKKNDDGMMV